MEDDTRTHVGFYGGTQGHHFEVRSHVSTRSQSGKGGVRSGRDRPPSPGPECYENRRRLAYFTDSRVCKKEIIIKESNENTRG